MAEEPKDLLAKEIDEELRREQLLRLWDTYGTYVLAAVLAVVVGVGGWKYYEHQQAVASEAASTRYIIALRDFAVNRPAEAQKALEELAAGAPAGYAQLTRLRLAAHDAAAGQTAEAVAAFDGIAKDSSIDPLLADFARLQAAMLKLDGGAYADAKNRLTPLATDRGPWRHSAREMLGLAAFKAGRLAEARNQFQRLAADRTAPPGLSARAKDMLVVMAQADQVKSTPPATEKSEPDAITDSMPDLLKELMSKLPTPDKTK
jgi:hypothetical protein